MRNLTFLTSIALLWSTAAIEVSAQQGSGQGVGLNSQAHVSVGLSNRTIAQGQGALRSIGRGNATSSTTVGAQLKASGGANVGRSGAKVETQQPGRHRGVSLRSRGRAEMHARLGARKGQNPNAASPANPSTEPATTPKNDGRGQTPWERAGCSRADWHLAQRLAVIDKQRDIALQNGNEVLLQQADKLEAQARLQHQQKTGVFAEQPSSGSPSSAPDSSPSTPDASSPPAPETPTSTEQPAPTAN
jgi:hypothetical protein